MVYRTAVKVGVCSPKRRTGAPKEFVRSCAGGEPDAVRGSALGRWFPVPSRDRRAVLAERPPPQAVFDSTRGYGDVRVPKNYKFTILNNENVWAKAANRVLNEKIPVDKAVDEMIARIKQVAG